MLSNIGKGITNAAEAVSKEAGKLSHSAEQKFHELNTTPLLESFQTGNVIQLVSRSSGKALQIVSDSKDKNKLVLDGCGPEGTPTENATWVCINEGSHVVHLHNNKNFIAIKDGKTYLAHYEPASAGPETKLKVKQMDKNFVCLMSVDEHGRHVGILPTGELKEAIATGSENDGQFGVRIITQSCKNEASKTAT
jgi:hypothetical protein